MIALKEIRYAGKTVEPGGTFEVRERDVTLLRAIKRARFPDGDTQDIYEHANEDNNKSSSPPKRSYKRRDMKAE